MNEYKKPESKTIIFSPEDYCQAFNVTSNNSGETPGGGVPDYIFEEG